jgi:hypothetical protein
MDNEFVQEMKWYQSLEPLEQATYDEIHAFGLPGDYFNEWSAFDMLNASSLDALRPIPTFVEYVRNTPWSQELKDFVLKRSKPEKVRQVDSLATEFNAALGKIQAEKDLKALRDFYRKSMDIQKS